MRLEWARVPRRPDWPPWALALVLLWGALVASAVYLEGRTGQPISLCLFRRLTGWPCLTCGSTRAVLGLLRGDVVGALAANPLVVAVGALATLALALRVALGRELRLHPTALQGRLAWAGAFALGLGNWAYLVLRGG